MKFVFVSSFLIVKATCKGLQRRAAVKGIATGFNRQSKLQGCSEVYMNCFRIYI